MFQGVETSYYFTFDQKEACKDLWKCCIEHHAFFRLTQVESTEPKVLNTIFQLGSKFRYRSVFHFDFVHISAGDAVKSNIISS